MFVPNLRYQKLCLDLIGDNINQIWFLLLKADIAPDDDTEWADITEADFAGYNRIMMPAWTDAVENGDGEAEITAATLTWTFTGGAPQDIYGIAFARTDFAPPHLYGVEMIPGGPITLSNPGDPLAYTPRMQLREKPA